MVKKKISCVIEARMGSKRFPGKSLKKLNKTHRLVDFVIKNALSSKYLNSKNIYFLTSNSRNNFSLIKHVKKKYKINVIIGSEENVFSRYNLFKKKKKLAIIRLTGDNPLVDPKLIDKFIHKFFQTKTDYLTSRAMDHSKNWNVKSSYPKGLSLEAFYTNNLFVNEKKFNSTNYSSPTWFFFNRLNKIKIKKFNSFGNYRNINSKLSFTLDKKKDYNFLKRFIKKYKCIPGKNNIWQIFKKKINDKV